MEKSKLISYIQFLMVHIYDFADQAQSRETAKIYKHDKQDYCLCCHEREKTEAETIYPPYGIFDGGDILMCIKAFLHHLEAYCYQREIMDAFITSIKDSQILELYNEHAWTFVLKDYGKDYFFEIKQI